MTPSTSDPSRLLLGALKAGVQALERQPESRHVLELCVVATRAAAVWGEMQLGKEMERAMNYLMEALCLFQTGELLDANGFFNRTLTFIDELSQSIAAPQLRDRLLEFELRFGQWLSQAAMNGQDVTLDKVAQEVNWQSDEGEDLADQDLPSEIPSFLITLSGGKYGIDTREVLRRLRALGRVPLFEETSDETGEASRQHFLFIGVAFSHDIEDSLPGLTVDSYRLVRRPDVGIGGWRKRLCRNSATT